jgi:hypothetical protein
MEKSEKKNYWQTLETLLAKQGKRKTFFLFNLTGSTDATLDLIFITTGFALA